MRLKQFIGIMLIAAMSIIIVQAQQDTGVRAQASNTVNMRAGSGIEYDIVGQMVIGQDYPVVGRSAQYPWVLLGDPASLQPVGWVFQDIVALTGNIFDVPVSTAAINNNPPTATTQFTAPTQVSASATQSVPVIVPSPTPAFTVAGTAKGEINIRYGPGTEFPRLGVVQAGERFQITGWHTQYPWVQVRYESSPTDEAWILIDLLEIEGDIYTLPATSSTIFNLPTLTPTPSVIQSSVGSEPKAVQLSAEFVALGNQIWQRLLQMGYDPQTSLFGSLFLVDLQTGEAITFGGNIAYRGTSINKITILATLYGVLNVPPTESIATDIANTMICSENSATNRLLAVIGDGDEWEGSQKVTNFLQTLGLHDTFLLAPYTVDPEKPPIPPYPIAIPDTEADQERAHPEPYNQMTVQDIGWLLADIYECAYEESGPLIELFPPGTYEPRECRQMIHVMTNNNVDSLLKIGVPEDTRYAHKHGWIDDTHSNAGIFFTPGGDYVMAMAFHSTQIDATGNRWLAYTGTTGTQAAFAETSRSVYNYFNPTQPMLETREGFIPDAPTCNFAGTPLISDLQQGFWDQ